ncbi:MAG: hypothetical protein ABIH42_02715, partial [Planctomycetota bacterium]
MNFHEAARNEKILSICTVLVCSALFVVCITVAKDINSIILFAFIEPVLISCVMPFLLRSYSTQNSPFITILRPLTETVVFIVILGFFAILLGVIQGYVLSAALSTLFMASFALLITGITVFFSLLFSVSLGQVISAIISFLIISAPFYLSYILRIVPSGMKLSVAQAVVNINPITAVSASVLEFDWLRSPRMYSICPIGGEQFPFYYPSAVKVAIIYFICGLLLLG